MVIGLAVLIFAVVQTWDQLASSERSLLTPYHPWLFSVVVGILGLVIMYEMLRLILFGKLASFVTTCSGSEFKKYKQNYQNMIRNKKGFPDWCDLSDLRKVSVYTSAKSKDGLGLLLSVQVFKTNKKDEMKGVVRSFWILALGFALSFAFSYSFVFGSLDWSFLMVIGSGSFVAFEAVHYGFWRIVELVRAK